jgi:hypothetical protein
MVPPYPRDVYNDTALSTKETGCDICGSFADALSRTSRTVPVVSSVAAVNPALS